MPLNQSSEAEKETDKLVGIPMPLPKTLVPLTSKSERFFYYIRRVR
jgi:hypothetical protein